MVSKLPESDRLGYPVYLGRDLWSELPEILGFSQRSSLFVVTDENVRDAWGERFRHWVPESGLLVVPPGEASKSLAVAAEQWSRLAELGADRYSLVVAIGGGMVGDLAGFVASTYMRGVDCAVIPTTLLSQVDSSVGSKVGINFVGTKNLLGSFRAPSTVAIDLETLSTLPERELRAGWAEVLKHALIADPELWELCREPGYPDESTIARAVGIKANIVIQDEFERGARRLLNLGHTVGHAVEAESGALGGADSDASSDDEVLRHGEAVAIGLVAAARLSVEVRGLPNEVADEIESKLARFGLPVRIPSSMASGRLLGRIAGDKKKRGRRVEWTLLDRIGQGCHGIEVPSRSVESVLKQLGARP